MRILDVSNFLLKEIIKYSNHKSLLLTQQIVNYAALAMLFTLCWVVQLISFDRSLYHQSQYCQLHYTGSWHY